MTATARTTPGAFAARVVDAVRTYGSANPRRPARSVLAGWRPARRAARLDVLRAIATQ